MDGGRRKARGNWRCKERVIGTVGASAVTESFIGDYCQRLMESDNARTEVGDKRAAVGFKVDFIAGQIPSTRLRGSYENGGRGAEKRKYSERADEARSKRRAMVMMI